MKSVVVAAAIWALLSWGMSYAHAGEDKNTQLRAAVAAPSAADPVPLRCIGFSPYVSGVSGDPNYNPDTGPHPSQALIASLLDQLTNQTNFRCIMTYGVLNGLYYTFEAAKQRNIKVIAIIWLDEYDSPASTRAVNNASIAEGIRAANEYPDTIVRVSCGNEVRTRARLKHGTTEPLSNGTVLDGEITRCIDALRDPDAHVVQPITMIDTWWEWCNTTKPCQSNAFADKVDWIGINVYPWWENKKSDLFPCTTAAQAPRFHINRIRDVRATYPGKDVIITEFGWPAGPEGYSEVNHFTGWRCGIAGELAQTNVIAGTIKKLNDQEWSWVVFEAFREPWKGEATNLEERPVGPYWGICESADPYTCNPEIGRLDLLLAP